LASFLFLSQQKLGIHIAILTGYILPEVIFSLPFLHFHAELCLSLERGSEEVADVANFIYMNTFFLLSAVPA
jgi:hypothetical protein